MYQVNADVVREAVLAVAHAEYRLRQAWASADSETFQVGPAAFAHAVLPCGKTMRQLWDAKQRAIGNLTGGVLGAAPGRIRAQAVQMAYGIAKQGTPVCATALDRQISHILALGERPEGGPPNGGAPHVFGRCCPQTGTQGHDTRRVACSSLPGPMPRQDEARAQCYVRVVALDAPGGSG
jgi:hypothetical protein